MRRLVGRIGGPCGMPTLAIISASHEVSFFRQETDVDGRPFWVSTSAAMLGTVMIALLDGHMVEDSASTEEGEQR